MLISPPSQAGTTNDFVQWIAQRGDGAEIIREAFRDDGVRRRAEWLGRADYPDVRKARWWLALMLETLRHYARPDAGHVFWGEVTAGQFAEEHIENDGMVVLLGGWRPVERRGATATAHLRGPQEPIFWDQGG